MFVNRKRAGAELARVCRPDGWVLATEFFWLRPPTVEARQLCLGEVCPGLRFDTVEEWVSIYGGAGLANVRTECRPFEMMTGRRFLADEGRHAAAVVARGVSRAIPYLGYVLVMGAMPDSPADSTRGDTEE